MFKPIAVVLAIASPTFAQPDLSTRIRARLTEEVEQHKIVGISIAIGHEGKIIANESLGHEDRENNIPASSQTMYRWASVSKPVTAVIAMQLAKEGKLDLDADIRTLVPEFPEKPWPITSRQLLCHQGGVVHYTNGKVIKTERTYDAPHPFQDVILSLDDFKESPLVCEPGTKYSYTTRGFMLLSAVAERAAAKDAKGEKPSFADLVKTRISIPCGMTTMQPDYQWIDIPHSAVGYKKNATGDYVKSTDTDVSWKLGGGGFISTATDMALFGQGLLTGKLLDDATREQMWTRQKTKDGTETGYGLGFSIRIENGRRQVEHSGAQEKAATHLLLLPDHNIVIAAMSNTEGIRLGALTHDLAKILLPASPAPK